jgi:purine-binding chemotaxis protein CheW
MTASIDSAGESQIIFKSSTMETVRHHGAGAKGTGDFKIIVFRQGEEEYGLPIDQIKGVVVTPKVTRMPRTPAYIKGVANISGSIIPILDLEEKFLLKRVAQEIQTNHYTLVVENDDFKMGVLVRDIPDTLTIPAAQFNDLISIIDDHAIEGNYIKGFVKTGKRLIILIDIFKMIDQETISTFKKTAMA